MHEPAAAPGFGAAVLLADGRAAAITALRHTTVRAFLRLGARSVRDAVRGWFGGEPLLVPLAGAPGTVALLTAPDARDGDRALNPGNRYPEWRQEVAARLVLSVGLYRPGRFADRARCPLLVVAYDDDQAVLAEPAVMAARRAPKGELVRLPGGHYAAFLEAHEATVDAELAFLRRHFLTG